MSVRIVEEHSAVEHQESDYLRVSTCSDPVDDTVTLATIQRFIEKAPADKLAPARVVKTIVLLKPMSSDQALGFATCYAERKNIPVVYTD